MTSAYRDLVDRVAASIQEDLRVIDPGFNAFTIYPYVHGRLPYANVFLGGRGARQFEVGAEWDDFEQTVRILLVLDHKTADYDGNIATKLYDTYLPQIYATFYANCLLLSAAYPTEPTYTGFVEDAQLTHAGWQSFTNSGTTQEQLGCLFTLTMPMRIVK